MADAFWDQFETQDPTQDQSRSFNPADASPTTGIAGGGGMPSVGTALGSALTQTANTAASTMGGSDPQAFFNQLFPGDTLTPDMLTQNEQTLAAHGIKLIKNAAGVPGKIQLPSGEVVDVIQGAGSGLNKKQWLTGGGGGGQGSALAGLGYGFGASMAPFTGQYALPTLDEFKASPMYGAGLDAFNRANQNSAAARGTLLNGRTNEAMNKSALDYGLTQYASLAGLNSGVFDRNYQIFRNNQTDPFEKNLSLAQLGAPK